MTIPTRRGILHGLVATTALAASPGGVQLAFGAAAVDARFVVVILRGGMDGLAAIAPYGERAYRRQRGDLALPEPGAPDGLIDLDGRFGLHPALGALAPFYARGELAIAHAVGIPYRNRSHFDAQNVLENGTDKPHSTADGWLNRAIAALQPGGTPAGLAVGANVPLIIRGDARYTTYAPQRLPDIGGDFVTRLRNMYAQDDELATVLAEALKAKEMREGVLGRQRGGMGRGNAGSGAFYREAFGAVGKLLADAKGPRVAVLDTDGWDTHAFQGTTQGVLATQFGYLNEGLASLHEGLAAAWRQSVVLVVSEFGRTAAINGTKGTDHGAGGVVLLLGGAVAGGRMVSPWPGLETPQLYEARDLAVTTDVRGLFKGVLRDHLGIAEGHIEDVVFPNSRDARAIGGLIRA